MSAVAIFQAQTDQPVLLIPRDAIIRNEEGGAQVWVVDSDGGSPVVASRVLELGPPRGTSSVVISGLSEADRVVVRGNESLREGQAVRIVDQTAPAMDSSE